MLVQQESGGVYDASFTMPANRCQKVRALCDTRTRQQVEAVFGRLAGSPQAGRVTFTVSLMSLMAAMLPKHYKANSDKALEYLFTLFAQFMR
jgi:hypothetical protein